MSRAAGVFAAMLFAGLPIALLLIASIRLSLAADPHKSNASVRASDPPSVAARLPPQAVRNGRELVLPVVQIRPSVERVQLRLSVAQRVAAARVAANEDSRPLRAVLDGGTEGRPTADTLAILQVVRDWAWWANRSHGASLRQLAPRVTGLRAATRRRHAAYGGLPLVGLARPPLWVERSMAPGTRTRTTGTPSALRCTRCARASRRRALIVSLRGATRLTQ